MTMSDPEIRDLQVATARAYAMAERLAHELEHTVMELLEYVEYDAGVRKAARGSR